MSRRTINGLPHGAKRAILTQHTAAVMKAVSDSDGITCREIGQHITYLTYQEITARLRRMRDLGVVYEAKGDLYSKWYIPEYIRPQVRNYLMELSA